MNVTFRDCVEQLFKDFPLTEPEAKLVDVKKEVFQHEAEIFQSTNISDSLHLPQ